VKLLLDPILLTDIPTDREKCSAFWARVVAWAGDSRAAVGQATHEHVFGEYASKGYPEQDLDMFPNALRTEYRRALSTLLSRVVLPASDGAQPTTVPAYRGPAAAANALVNDAARSVGSGVVGIATCEESWTARAQSVSFLPPPPSELELCVEPGSPLGVEDAKRTRKFFANRRIHIVGGQPIARVTVAISKLTGLPESEIAWIPAEKGKPPRDIKKRWSRLQPERDITACVTGRIGHAQSEAAARAAEGCGVVHLLVESANELPDRLKAMVVRS
jgi:hypothetical protein